MVMASRRMNTFYRQSERIWRHWRLHGAGSTLSFLASRVFRRRRYVVFDACLEGPRPCTQWVEGEQLCRIGPNEVDTAMTPAIRAFLGDDARENIEGVRQGDQLFVVTTNDEVQHCGYILFRTRQTKILGEGDNPPLIANCQTAPAARGRGLYRKALNAELCYLKELGYRRAVIETGPENIPSRKGIEAAGFRFLREVTAYILLNCLLLQKVSEGPHTRWRLVSV
jgi:RimJ/RimL family protein N-acetyltransferase